MRRTLLAVLAILSATSGHAQMPVPALPRIFVDTAWQPPTGGKTWVPHTSAEFQRSLDSAMPGDLIVLDAGASYRGSFSLPAKANPDHKWIYIQSSALQALPAPGQRVQPQTDSAKMPKIVTTTFSPALSILPGATYYRLAGLEIASASSQGCDSSGVPAQNCFSYFLVDMPAAQGKALPDSIVVDRCYLHGSDTQDVRAGVVANGTRVAVIDSYISDIHLGTTDSQAIRAYWTPGPIKIVNNFLSATTENVLFGGAGGADNPYVPSDIEIRNNYFFKPEDWAKPGRTLPPAARWSVKNSLEFKSARRALVSNNVFENNWAGGQKGFAIVLTVRTSDSGNVAVVTDITIENNVLRNVASGFNTLEVDDLCRLTFAPLCNNPGETKRLKIANNLIEMRGSSAPGGYRPTAIQFLPDVTDVVFDHNTTAMAAEDECSDSVYFSVAGGSKWPLPKSSTHNIWITNNILCKPPTGDLGGQGTAGLMSYMGDPRPLDPRFTGNIILVPGNRPESSVPAGNLVTRGPLHYSDRANTNYQLRSPTWKDTTDGKPPGVDATALRAVVASAVGQASGR